MRSLPIAVIGIGQSRGDDDDVASFHRISLASMIFTTHFGRQTGAVRPALPYPLMGTSNVTGRSADRTGRKGIQTFPIILWNKIPAPRIRSDIIDSIDIIE